MGADASPSTGEVGPLVGALSRDGYVVVENVLSPAQVADKRAALAPLLAETPYGNNSFLGHRTRRVYSLLAKTRAFDDLVLHPAFLEVAAEVLGPFQLGVVTGIEVGGGESAQTLHADDGVYPLPTSVGPLTLNSLWALCDFSAANGATRLVPGSHTWPEKRLDAATPAPEVVAETPAGSVVLYLGSLLHGAGPNHTATDRLAVVVEYCVGWVRPQENLGLTYPPTLARQLPPRLAELVGYSLYPPFLGYVDGRDPRFLLDDDGRPPPPGPAPS